MCSGGVSKKQRKKDKRKKAIAEEQQKVVEPSAPTVEEKVKAEPKTSSKYSKVKAMLKDLTHSELTDIGEEVFRLLKVKTEL